MPFPQNTPPQNNPTSRGLGSSDAKALRQAFAGPINLQEEQFASVEALRAQYEELVMNGNVSLEGDVAAYYGVTEYTPDYVDAPNLADVESGAGGLPGTPYIPNVASPGEGSMNPLDLPTPPEGVGVSPGDVPFSGVPITANDPSSTSVSISGTKIGQGAYKTGKSSASE